MKNICNNWNLSNYKYINFTPDNSVSESHRKWQGCPSIVVTKGGRLFASWYSGGAFEPCIHNYCIVVMSDDCGKTWSEPIFTVGSDYSNRLRNIDIQLWIDNDNTLWAMWTVSPYNETSVQATIKTPFSCDYHCEFPYTMVMKCKNPDDDMLIWEKPQTMCEGFTRNKPISTSSGKIIAPGYDYGSTQYKIRCSDNDGASFKNIAIDGKPDINVYDEIMVCERRCGELRLIARTNQGYYVYSDSTDDGLSWTEAKEYEKAPSSRCYYGKLKNGMIAYVRNVSDTSRIGIKICISEDGGNEFPYEMILDERENVSYPDLDEDENGNIYIIYDRERDNRIKLNKETWMSEAAKEIIVCKITIEDIINKKLSEHSYIRKVISKAKKDIVEI